MAVFRAADHHSKSHLQYVTDQIHLTESWCNTLDLTFHVQCELISDIYCYLFLDSFDQTARRYSFYTIFQTRLFPVDWGLRTNVERTQIECSILAFKTWTILYYMQKCVCIEFKHYNLIYKPFLSELLHKLRPVTSRLITYISIHLHQQTKRFCLL